jgi:hypothetical protein
MMRVGRPRQRFRGALPEKPLDPEPLGANTLEVELGRPSARNDDEVDPLREQVRVGPEALTAEPFHAVSLHGAANSPPHDQAEPRRARHAPSGQQEREVGRPDAAGAPIALRAHELCVLAEPSVGPEGHGARRPLSCRLQEPPYFL